MVVHPKFKRPNVGRSSRSRLKDVWRKPRGIDNKQRVHIKYMGESPSIGWRGKRKERGFHPSGLKEVLVSNVSSVRALKGSNVALRIAATVGKRKREEIMKTAQELNLKVLNP